MSDTAIYWPSATTKPLTVRIFTQAADTCETDIGRLSRHHLFPTEALTSIEQAQAALAQAKAECQVLWLTFRTIP